MAGEKGHALVTGAGTGIGKQTALALARQGFDVAVHYRTHKAEAEGVAKEITDLGRKAFPVAGDLTSKKDIEQLAQTLGKEFPSLEVLVNNAGEYPRRTIEDLDEEEFMYTLITNLWAPYVVTRELLPQLRKAPWGRIIFVGSVLALNGSTHGADYAASKAAIGGLAKSLARELAPQITVNVVAPGSIDTAILAADTPEVRAQRERTIPLGRLGQPEDVAGVIAFLASPEASYLTGTTVHVNGGLRMD
jgi:3-oxoacyl-[acyl-carrier protein] reductase